MNDRQLAYDRTGQGPRLLFQHGLGACRRQASGLVGPEFPATLIALDAPSHGESEHAPELHAFDAVADAAVALLDELDLPTAVFGGISMGAGVSLNAALRHPDRVEGLILIRPAWLAQAAPSSLALISRLGRWLSEQGATDARERLHEDRDFCAMSERAGASVEAILDRPGAASRADVLVDMVADAPFSALADLRTVESPALVLATSGDPLHPIAMAEQIADTLPHAAYHLTPPRYIEPDAHARAVRTLARDFLPSLSNLT